MALAFGCVTQTVPSRRGGILIAVALGMLLLVVAGWVAVTASAEPAHLTP